jgi:hypothetical protein
VLPVVITISLFGMIFGTLAPPGETLDSVSPGSARLLKWLVAGLAARFLGALLGEKDPRGAIAEVASTYTLPHNAGEPIMSQTHSRVSRS